MKKIILMKRESSDETATKIAVNAYLIMRVGNKRSYALKQKLKAAGLFKYV